MTPQEIVHEHDKQVDGQGAPTEAEVRDILEQAVLPGGRLKLGTMLAAIG